MKAFLLVLLLVPLASDADETGDAAASVAQQEKLIAQWAPPGALEGHFSNDFVGHYFSDQPFEKVWAHYAQLLGINRPYRDNGSEGMGTRVGQSLENRIIHASSDKNRKERVSTLIRRAGDETTTVTISQDRGRLMITVIIQPHRN